MIPTPKQIKEKLKLFFHFENFHTLINSFSPEKVGNIIH